MKKLYAMLIGLLAFWLLVLSFDQYLTVQIKRNDQIIRNHRTYERFWSGETQKLIMDENTLPIFGSSELVSLEDYTQNVSSFLNASDMNIVTIGAGNFQSLSHTMTLGAISERIDKKKVALFLSPQWFGGSLEEAFPGRFGEENLLAFLENSSISDENKEYVLNRTLNLLVNSPTQYARVEKYKRAFSNKLSIESIYTSIMRSYWKLRGKYSVFQQLGDMNREIPSVDLENLDFEEVLQMAEEQGKSSCTNNDFGIYDTYWDTYVKETYEKGEVKEKKEFFVESQEYEDLRCFLKVAQELDVEVILVSIPVNEKWYSFKGILCDEYYENIRLIAEDFDNVVLVDMTKYADEKYFLKDIMHLGWKGWTRINEALYREFKKE